MFVIMTDKRQMSLNRHGNKNKLSNLFTEKIKERKPGSAYVGSATRLFRHVVFVYVAFLRLNRCLWFSFTPCPALPLAALARDETPLRRSELRWLPRCRGSSLPHSGLSYIKPLFPAALQFRQDLCS